MARLLSGSSVPVTILGSSGRRVQRSRPRRPYLQLADEAICIGPPASTDSYLNYKNIIAAAELANVEAIHPGYGFLSENAHFAEVCRTCHIEFIGPPEEAMRKLGNKNAARKLAQEAGVPVVPGSEGLIQHENEGLRWPGRSATRSSSRPRPAAVAEVCASLAMILTCGPV